MAVDTRARRAIAMLALALFPMSACDRIPRDPERSLERARGGVLRVGVTGAPPWIVRGRAERSVVEEPDPRPLDDPATGPEADLVLDFARSIGSRVVWIWGPLDEHMERLQGFELDLVAAGLTERTEWRHRVGLTTPWLHDGDHKRVLAVAPGENALLSALERYIRERARAPHEAADSVGGP